MVNAYSSFKVLLDDPADMPGLRFDDYAAGLAEIITTSRAEFAVGIFGSWGSGKTTLMRAVERRLASQDNLVTVWFTAWRYEKERHLIVPLLDVLREELERRGSTEEDEHGTVKRAAAAIARAGRAFLAGLTVTTRLPGVDAAWNPEATIAALKADDNVGAESLSFYHAGFVMLRDAIREFSAGGTRRVVVFVDDLDRCLPANALDVLESMKLFFDVEGFVFVVGLDQDIAERAVALKYGQTTDEPEQQSIVSGTDYVKKIFQVPFTLPAIGTDQLQEYLTSVAENADFSPEQREDFQRNVRRHLRFIHGGDSVNPREVKRLINTYTLQLKMLSARLGDGLDPNIVLALQCMTFRPEWRDLYDHLAADPAQFQRMLHDVVHGQEAPDLVWLSGARVAVPAEFAEYLRGHASGLLDAPNLRSYVSAAESTHSTDPSLLELQMTVNRIRRTTHRLMTGEFELPEASTQLRSDVSRLIDTRSKHVRGSVQLESAARDLESIVRNLASGTDVNADRSGAANTAAEAITPLLDVLDNQLRDMRRRANVGAYR